MKHTSKDRRPEQPAADEAVAMPDLLQIAKAAALEAGNAILEIYTSGDFEVEMKSDDSPLTKADRAAHEIIARHLATTGFPILSEEGLQTPFQERVKWPWYWLVDPLDGTKEFLKRNGEFTVNIALMRQSKPVAGVIHAPSLNTLYHGSRETGVYKEAAGGAPIRLQPIFPRRTLDTLLRQQQVKIVASRTHLNQETEDFMGQFGPAPTLSMGSSLKFMLLAEGKAHLYPRFAPTMEWDTAAAHAILAALNLGIYQQDLKTELTYNKQELLNPSFVVF